MLIYIKIITLDTVKYNVPILIFEIMKATFSVAFNINSNSKRELVFDRILNKRIQQMKLQGGVEYYDHRAAYQLGGNNLGSFADFSYYLFTASLNLKF